MPCEYNYMGRGADVPVPDICRTFIIDNIKLSGTPVIRLLDAAQSQIIIGRMSIFVYNSKVDQVVVASDSIFIAFLGVVPGTFIRVDEPA